jgi:hypothetical protein
MKKPCLFLGVLIGSCLVHPGMAQEKKDQPESKYGWKTGESMPFHVVDFIAGARDKGAGCPSVMINNAAGRGVIIWSRSADDQAFDLAAKLEAKLAESKNALGFLVPFGEAPKEGWSKKAGQHALKKFQVATPRSSTKELFQQADPSGKSASIVFFLHRKQIQSVWALGATELTKERMQSLVQEAEKFLATKE